MHWWLTSASTIPKLSTKFLSQILAPSICHVLIQPLVLIWSTCLYCKPPLALNFFYSRWSFIRIIFTFLWHCQWLWPFGWWHYFGHWWWNRITGCQHWLWHRVTILHRCRCNWLRVMYRLILGIFSSKTTWNVEFLFIIRTFSNNSVCVCQYIRLIYNIFWFIINYVWIWTFSFIIRVQFSLYYSSKWRRAYWQ